MVIDPVVETQPELEIIIYKQEVVVESSDGCTISRAIANQPEGQRWAAKYYPTVRAAVSNDPKPSAYKGDRIIRSYAGGK